MKKSYIFMMTIITALLFISGSAEETLFHSDGIGEFPQTRGEEYVSLMGDEEDEAFDEVLTKAWENMEPSINISQFYMTIAEYQSQQSRYKMILEENPVYTIYTDGATQATSYDGVYIYEIFPEYRISDIDKAKELRKSIDAATEEILFNISDTMSDFDKIMAVHDYMVLNYSYDTTLSNFSISIMATKTGVCQSYAYTFKHLMNMLDIDCTYVPSRSMKHVWNLVKLDGKWYHTDVTWDDPVSDAFGQVRHNYALKSTDAFSRTTYPDSPHYGFDTGDLKANSKKYDDPEWHTGVGSIVHCNGITYWWDEDDLVDSNGNHIVDDIIGNRKWKIDNRYTYKYDDDIFAGLATHNGKLYYNSDSAICCYDPATKKTETIKSQIGLSGLYINNNILYYTVSELSPDNSINIVKGGEIGLGGFSAGGSYREDADTVVTRICNTSDEPVMVFLFDGTKTKTEECESGITKIEMETDAPTYIFVWDSSLRPLAQKKKID